MVIKRRAATSTPSLPIVLGAATIYLPLSQMIDVAAERARLTKEQ